MINDKKLKINVLIIIFIRAYQWLPHSIMVPGWNICEFMYIKGGFLNVNINTLSFKRFL